MTPRILIYRISDTRWLIHRPTAYGKRSFEIAFGHWAIHFYRKPRTR